MNPLKRLASQTIIYGFSSIAGRFLNYLLVPLYTYYFAPNEYGIIAELYAYMGFFSVFLLLGLETGYFRFRNDNNWNDSLVYSTVLRAVLVFNGLFVITMLLLLQPLAAIMRYVDHTEYLMWMIIILAIDAVGSVAFARLRAENKALRFASIKLIEIFINIALNIFFIGYCRSEYALDPNSYAGYLWSPNIGVGYVLLANLIASGIKLLLLMYELIGIKAGFNWKLLQQILRYSLPMVLIGLAGIVNEMLDRIILKFLLPYDATTNMAQLGIYSACYKLSIVMSLFIQAFRYAGEPFFFAYSKHNDAKHMYATVLNYFVIFCVLIFLIVTLYIDIFKYFIGASYRVGLHIIPILLLANLFLGIYVNLSIWYKLSDHTMLGAVISLLGAIITLILLLWWVPIFGYVGAAWATFVCYFSMTAISYLLSLHYYPIPYNMLAISGYILAGITIYGSHTWLITNFQLPPLIIGTVGIAIFMLLAFFTIHNKNYVTR
jgi:O-antigen/teichoic acid export membrane protein